MAVDLSKVATEIKRNNLFAIAPSYANKILACFETKKRYYDTQQRNS